MGIGAVDAVMMVGLCLTGSELSMFLDPLRLDEKELVLLAINDNVSTTIAGGSHW